MAAKTAKDAVDRFAGYFKETLSCVSGGYVTVFQESRRLYKITCDPPLRLTRRSGGHLYLIATQTLSTAETEEGFKAKTREYSYRLVETEDIAAADIIAYHWHPHDSDLRSPHLHVAELPRVHFATSRVSLEDFVMTLIRYYDIRPRLLTSEWTEILEKNKAAFEKHATWKIKHPA